MIAATSPAATAFKVSLVHPCAVAGRLGDRPDREKDVRIISIASVGTCPPGSDLRLSVGDSMQIGHSSFARVWLTNCSSAVEEVKQG